MGSLAGIVALTLPPPAGTSPPRRPRGGFFVGPVAARVAPAGGAGVAARAAADGQRLGKTMALLGLVIGAAIRQVAGSSGGPMRGGRRAGPRSGTAAA